MTSHTPNIETEICFQAKDPTRAVAAGILALAAVAVVSTWQSLVEGDAVIIGGTAAVVAAVALPLLIWARKAASRRFVISGRTARFNGKTIDLAAVKGLSERRVRAGKSSYTAFFAALADGTEVRLLLDGAYAEQDRLLEAIADRAGQEWERV